MQKLSIIETLVRRTRGERRKTHRLGAWRSHSAVAGARIQLRPGGSANGRRSGSSRSCLKWPAGPNVRDRAGLAGGTHHIDHSCENREYAGRRTTIVFLFRVQRLIRACRRTQGRTERPLTLMVFRATLMGGGDCMYLSEARSRPNQQRSFQVSF